jgi:3-oxoacyl-[acyl-carrier-protein] synthase-3
VGDCNVNRDVERKYVRKLLEQGVRPAGSRVAAWGHYQPSVVLTNDDLVARGLDSSDEWIRTRTGVTQRHIAAEGESLIDMAERAGRDAMTKSGVAAADIDLVIFATCTARTPVPMGAADLASRLGIASPGAYDLNAACAGFVYAISAASDAILCGHARNVLIIGAEKFSDWLDGQARSTAIIFADGAGAAVISAHDESTIGPLVSGSDGTHAQAIRMSAESQTIAQDGQTVYRWATSTMGDVALEVCRRTGVEPDELAVFAPHQANMRIIDLVAKKLGAANAHVLNDVTTSGNTSAASIPLALSKYLEVNPLPSGSPILLLGFGAGLSYAGQIVLSP